MKKKLVAGGHRLRGGHLLRGRVGHEHGVGAGCRPGPNWHGHDRQGRLWSHGHRGLPAGRHAQLHLSDDRTGVGHSGGHLLVHRAVLAAAVLVRRLQGRLRVQRIA